MQEMMFSDDEMDETKVKPTKTEAAQKLSSKIIIFVISFIVVSTLLMIFINLLK